MRGVTNSDSYSGFSELGDGEGLLFEIYLFEHKTGCTSFCRSRSLEVRPVVLFGPGSRESAPPKSFFNRVEEKKKKKKGRHVKNEGCMSSPPPPTDLRGSGQNKRKH